MFRKMAKMREPVDVNDVRAIVRALASLGDPSYPDASFFMFSDGRVHLSARLKSGAEIRVIGDTLEAAVKMILDRSDDVGKALRPFLDKAA